MSAEFNVDKNGNITMTVNGEEIDYPLRHLEDIENKQNKQNQPSDKQPPKNT